MNKKSIWSGLVTLLFAATLTACGGGGGGGDDDGDRGGSGKDGINSGSQRTGAELANAVASLDTTGAEGFVITGNQPESVSAAFTSSEQVARAMDVVSGAEVTLEPNSIYKVTESGNLTRVAIRDGDSEELPRGRVQPFQLMDINESFLMMWFWIPGVNCEFCQNGDGSFNLTFEDVVPYLVRKSDGAAFNAVEVMGSAAEGSDRNNNSFVRTRGVYRFLTDNAGNIFVGFSRSTSSGERAGQVVRIDISGIDSGDVTGTVLPNFDFVESFAVSGDGSYVIYEGNNRDDSFQNVARLVDVESGESENLFFGAGGVPGQMYGTIDGRTYALGSSSNNIFEVSRDATGTVNINDLGPLTVESTSGREFANFSMFLDMATNFEHLVIDGREFVIGDGENPDTPQFFPARHTYEIDFGNEAGPLVRRHDAVLDEFVRPQDSRDARVSGQFIWYFGTRASTGQDAIVRYDPITEATKIFEVITDPVTGSELDISEFRVLNSNRVYFEAQRLADGATVLGEIDGDGTVTIVDVIEGNEPQIFVLEPISPADFLVIDGRVNDWDIERRIATDNPADATSAGNEITHFSQWLSGGDYNGLVEFNSAIDQSSRTRIRINNDWELLIYAESAFLAPFDPATGPQLEAAQSLTAIGGAFAIASAVEFRVPESALGSPSSYTLQIARVGGSFIEQLSASFDASNPATHTLTIGLAGPIGSSELRVGLGATGYILVISDGGAVLTDGSSSQSVAVNFTGNSASIEIADSAIGGPNAALALTDRSGDEALFDELSAP